MKVPGQGSTTRRLSPSARPTCVPVRGSFYCRGRTVYDFACSIAKSPHPARQLGFAVAPPRSLLVRRARPGLEAKRVRTFSRIVAG